MKKKLILIYGLFSGIVHAQIGINTAIPQAVFHIDGANDNNKTSIPTVLQSTNDFVFTETGKVGIGTINPNSGLQMDNSLSLAVKLVKTSYTITDNDYSIIFNGIADPDNIPVLTLPNASTCKGRLYKVTNLNGGENGKFIWDNDGNQTEYGLQFNEEVIYALLDDGTILKSTSVYRLGNAVAGTKGIADRITIQSDGLNWYLTDY